MRRVIAQLFRTLGLKGEKLRKRTERLQTLFPLWYMGMARLSYVEQCEVLEQIGFSDTEIPTGDALRQMLSYHSIPKVVKSLERQRKLADKREPSKDE